MLVSTDEGDDSDRDGTECVRALRARAPPPAAYALEDPEDDLREIASRGSLKEPEQCASSIKPVSSSVSKMR